LIGVIGEVDVLETTLLEPLKRSEHTLEAKYFLGHLLDILTELLDILFNVNDRHLLI
jgi:hypothetical protein